MWEGLKFCLYVIFFRKKLEVLPEQISEKILDPRTISPLERTRAKKKVADNTMKVGKSASQKVSIC